MAKINIPHLIIEYKKGVRIPLTKEKEIHPLSKVDYNAFLEPLAIFIKQANYLSLKECLFYYDKLRSWKNSISNSLLAIYSKPFAYNKVHLTYKLIARKKMIWHHPWDLLKFKSRYYGDAVNYKLISDRLFQLLYNKNLEIIKTDNQTLINELLSDKSIAELNLAGSSKDKITSGFIKIIDEIKVEISEDIKKFRHEVKAGKENIIWMQILNRVIARINQENVFNNFKEKEYIDNRLAKSKNDEVGFGLNRIGALEDLEIDDPLFKTLEEVDELIAFYLNTNIKAAIVKQELIPNGEDIVFEYADYQVENNLIEGAEAGDIIIVLRKIDFPKADFTDIGSMLFRKIKSQVKYLSSNNSQLKNRWVFKLLRV